MEEYKMTISPPQAGVPSKILPHGLRMSMRKVVVEPKTTQEKLKLKAAGPETPRTLSVTHYATAK